MEVIKLFIHYYYHIELLKVWYEIKDLEMKESGWRG